VAGDVNAVGLRQRLLLEHLGRVQAVDDLHLAAIDAQRHRDSIDRLVGKIGRRYSAFERLQMERPNGTLPYDGCPASAERGGKPRELPKPGHDREPQGEIARAGVISPAYILCP